MTGYPRGIMGRVLAVLQARSPKATSHTMIARQAGCSPVQAQGAVANLRKAGFPVHHATGQSRYYYDPARPVVKKFERPRPAALAAVTPIGGPAVDYGHVASTIDYDQLIVHLVRAALWAYEHGYLDRETG